VHGKGSNMKEPFFYVLFVEFGFQCCRYFVMLSKEEAGGGMKKYAIRRKRRRKKKTIIKLVTMYKRKRSGNLEYNLSIRFIVRS
jgi:hypothetical protein